MSDKRHFTSKVFDQLLSHATIDWTVQYSTVQCAVDLIASMVCHLDWFIIWASEKLAHASQLYLLHINSDEIKSIKKLFLN